MLPVIVGAAILASSTFAYFCGKKVGNVEGQRGMLDEVVSGRISGVVVDVKTRGQKAEVEYTLADEICTRTVGDRDGMRYARLPIKLGIGLRPVTFAMPIGTTPDRASEMVSAWTAASGVTIDADDIEFILSAFGLPARRKQRPSVF